MDDDNFLFQDYLTIKLSDIFGKSSEFGDKLSVNNTKQIVDEFETLMREPIKLVKQYKLKGLEIIGSHIAEFSFRENIKFIETDKDNFMISYDDIKKIKIYINSYIDEISTLLEMPFNENDLMISISFAAERLKNKDCDCKS